jgi:hypothetical protein
MLDSLPVNSADSKTTSTVLDLVLKPAILSYSIGINKSALNLSMN